MDGSGPARLAAGMSSTQRARSLRATMSKPEVLLWMRLKVLRPLGYHMRRQAPVGPYFADFMCKPARLVIEVDGAQHLEAAAHRRDTARDAWLARRGYQTLRFHASEVLADPDDVCRQILDRLKARLPEPSLPGQHRSPPVPSLRSGPPSPEGEG